MTKFNAVNETEQNKTKQKNSSLVDIMKKPLKLSEKESADGLETVRHKLTR